MAKKLTEKDKSEILKLYYNPEETTSTLAARYGVSHSTISRLLKSTLLADEYEVLIQQKRSSRGQNVADVVEPEVVEEPEPEKPKPVLPQPKKVVKEKEPEELEEPEVSSEVEVSSARRSRKRSSAVASPVHEVKEELANKPAPPQVEFSEDPPEAKTNDELLDEAYNADVSTIREMLGEDLLDGEEDLDDDEDDDLDDDEDDEVLLTPRRRVQIGALIQVLPLSEASFPRPCYLVVDRAAELITRPLRDFGDLGEIPKDEIQQRTLPVFDNHRIARRFSNRNQRVIKVPDGRMLQKASPYLKAKGITRLLIDGQVYSLSPS
ncbi:sigma factor-like helix-turn-helix DNA-binding protein [Aerosakkonemataceae cyanobacterium BLCC-F50]|uniref:Sigma factor-like helix-turn-helix DNA-binding protein n=1 Tax=Floridaenema flaviceps BLCC-F50 TaxID=3153642 RepID=A0ABV4XVC5_9CYAN